jgi:hypothetical protein
MTRGHGGANGGGKLLYTRGEGLERPFIGKRSGKGKHGKLGSGLGLLPGEMNYRGAAATEAPAVALQYRKAAWRAGRVPTGGGLERWTGRRMTRGRGRHRRWPAVARSGALCRRQGHQTCSGAEQRSRAQGGRRGRNRTRD